MRAWESFKAALWAPANVVALAASSVASALTGDPTAVAVAGALEVLYLGVCSTPLGGRLLGVGGRPERSSAERLLAELHPSQREHYFTLEALRDRILENYRRLPGGGVVAASSEAHLAALLESSLRLLGTLNSYRRYLSATDRSKVEQELKDLMAELAGESNPRVREVKEKRVEILKKRMARFTKAEDSREVVSHQLAGIEDLIRLTHEQSIAIRDPDSVSRQLEVLTHEVSATEETVRELERFLELGDEVSSVSDVRSRVR